jgi:hydrogenase-4 component F
VLLLVLLLPTVAGLAAFLVRADRTRRTLLVGTALGHLALVAAMWARPPAPAWNRWLDLDAVGLLFLSLTSLLFTVASFYAVGYLKREGHQAHRDFEEGRVFSDAPEARFVGCLLLFLASMTLVTVTQHLGLLWVAVEATTLASAPLISFHRHHRSLEATWKYLLICSVGIALALLGTFFVAVAAARPGGESASMLLADLMAEADLLQPGWLRAGFILLLVGYGTKMGLAPLHTWLPDAHAEAPSVASALLSGALLNCAFVGILRGQQLLGSAGLAAFGRDLLVVLGLVSMTFAAVFVIRQADFKRLLAYSSVEHMGIMALGVGLGGAATFGALLHAVNHSVVKGMLFMVSGNLLAAYRTKSTLAVRGAVRALPVSGVLWLVGLFAITGSPPFGTFLSELTILKGALDAGRWWVAAGYLALLGAVFAGMGRIMVRMAQGEPGEGVAVGQHEAWSAVLPAVVLLGLALLLGLWIPRGLAELLGAAGQVVGGAAWRV